MSDAPRDPEDRPSWAAPGGTPPVPPPPAAAAPTPEPGPPIASAAASGYPSAPSPGQPSWSSAPQWSAPVPPRAGGLALAALITGIVGALFAIVPFLCFLAFLPAVAAVVLGILALAKRTTRRGFGITGLVLGGAGILVALVMTVVTIAILVGFAEAARDGADDLPSSSDQFDDGTPEGAPSDEAPTSETPDDLQADPGGPFVEGYHVSGAGEEVVPIGSVDGDDYLGIAVLAIHGDGAFEVYARDADGEDVEWVTSGTGDYSGTVVYNSLAGEVTTAFHVTSDGDWTIELHSADWIDTTDSVRHGTGDDIVSYDGAATEAEISCTSGDWLSVWSSDSGTLLDEECPYTGTVELPVVGGLLQIFATSDWTFTPVVEIT